jgi:hypothetical protein
MVLQPRLVRAIRMNRVKSYRLITLFIPGSKTAAYSSAQYSRYPKVARGHYLRRLCNKAKLTLHRNSGGLLVQLEFVGFSAAYISRVKTTSKLRSEWKYEQYIACVLSHCKIAQALLLRTETIKFCLH